MSGRHRRFRATWTREGSSPYSQDKKQTLTLMAKTWLLQEFLSQKSKCQAVLVGNSKMCKRKTHAGCVIIGSTLCTFGTKKLANTTIETTSELTAQQKRTSFKPFDNTMKVSTKMMRVCQYFFAQPLSGSPDHSWSFLTSWILSSQQQFHHLIRLPKIMPLSILKLTISVTCLKKNRLKLLNLLR